MKPSRKTPERCKSCVLLNYGMPQTRYAIWCCGHSMPAEKADPHCRNGPANDKRRTRDQVDMFGRDLKVARSRLST